MIDQSDSGSLLDALTSTIRGSVVSDPSLVMSRTRDQCMIATAGLPLAVVLAESTADVQSVMRFATANHVKVVVRGAGTGLAGGANAQDGCIVLSLERMDAVRRIDKFNRLAHVEAGVLNGDLDREARQFGLFYPPDPGSRDMCTIGGNIATNAGGMCCARYGVTRDHVLQLTAVLPSGELFTVGRQTRKDSAGLSLVQLIVGSEGSLCVVTEAIVRLTPVPAEESTVVATFDSAMDAMNFVSEHLGDASAVEFMDRVTVGAVNEMTGMALDASVEATLLIKLESTGISYSADDCVRAARTNGAKDTYWTNQPSESEQFWAARRAALPALEKLGSILLDDVCVPLSNLVTMHRRIGTIAQDLDVTIGTFGHAADGNLHPTIIFDIQDEGSRRRAEQAFDRIVRAAIELEGTITGEHGIGSIKASYLKWQMDPLALSLSREIERVFDPNRILAL